MKLPSFPVRGSSRHADRLIAFAPWVRVAAVAAVACGAVAARADAMLEPAIPPVTLDEVVVVGERALSYRAERVQVGTFRDVDPVDVPLTSNVVPREVLDAQSARGLFDALKNTAGVTRSQLSGATYDNLAIRGILVENRGNYRLNGSLPIVNLVDLPLENKERVEVLKGVSSLYYGFVPPSGIINLVTKRPVSKPLTAVTAQVNSHGGVGGHVDVSRRFGAARHVGVRVNAAGGTEEIGLDHFEGERLLGSVAADWRINGRALLRYDVEHVDKNVSEPAAIALLPAVAGVIPLPPTPPNTRNLGGSWQRYEASATNQLLRADLIVSEAWTVLAEVGHARTDRIRHFSQFRAYDLASGNGSLRISFARKQHYENTNGRAELFGRFLTGAVRHDLSLGVTGNRREQESGNSPTRDVPQNLYAPSVIPQLDSPSPWTSNPSHIDDVGVYVFDRVSAFKDRLQVIAGARYSDYESNTLTTRYQNEDINPAVSLLYKPTPRSSIYVSRLEGLEESGTAPASAANVGEVLPPLLGRQLEVGTKIEVFGGTLVQLAAFEIDRPSTFIDPATNRFTANGRARFRGAELAVSGELTPDVSVIASGLILDAAQRNRSNPATFEKVPENTARHTGSLFVDWRTPFARSLRLNAGAFYTGRRPVDNANQGFIGGYTTYTVGGSVMFPVAGRSVTARLTIDNLTNKNAWSTAGNGLLGVTLPRTAKLSLSAAF